MTATSTAKDRKHKCSSEQYVRERKSNAQKQFAYNKLKNEKQITLKHEQSKSNTAPKRPPQPKHMNVDKKEKEGMLIDLTSPQQQTTQDTASALNGFDCGIGGGGGGVSFIPKVMNGGMSILDTPIEVPTQGYLDDDESQTVDYFTNEPSKLEPPPYQSPPTYMNTYAINKSTPRYASALSMAATTPTATNQYGNLDPFDTSHISTAHSSQSNNAMPTFSYTTEMNASRLDSSFIQNPIQKTNYMDLASATQTNRLTTSATAELDEIVQNKIASLSPKRSRTAIHSERNTNSMASMIANDAKSLNLNRSNDDQSFKMGANSTLSDSLKVNLSSLTLNDTDEFENARSTPASNTTIVEQQNPKLDRAFLAELEKEMYKCDQSNVNMNNVSAKNDNASAMADAATATATATAATNVASSATSGKDTTVNAISSKFNWFKNDFTNNSSGNDDAANNAQTQHPSRNTPMTQSPAKIYNNESTTMIKLTNYESTAAAAAANMTLSKKLYNTDVNNVEPNGYAMSMKQTDGGNSSSRALDPSSSSTSTMMTTTTTTLQNDILTHNNYGPMVQSNNAQQMTAKYAKTLNTVASNTNTSNKYAMASDIYGSIAGGNNVYDIVASSGTSDYYQIIQPNESQTVIYDEVAADDDLMRPHRPAPGLPSGPPVLSAQQIQRRIERAQKGQSHQQQQQIYDNLNSTYANGFGGSGSGGGGGGGNMTTRNHYMYEEIMQKNRNTNFNGDGIDPESKETINVASSETMKNMKIEHLLR